MSTGKSAARKRRNAGGNKLCEAWEDWNRKETGSMPCNIEQKTFPIYIKTPNYQKTQNFLFPKAKNVV